jgi:hypothetical protein
MLHDRFYSEWVQPTSVVHATKLSVLLRIRIQKDGRISDYTTEGISSPGRATIWNRTRVADRYGNYMLYRYGSVTQ